VTGLTQGIRDTLKAEHVANTPATREGRTDPVQCRKCRQAWPCTTRTLLEALQSAESDRDWWKAECAALEVAR
jgi:hypothetical protein